MTSTNFFIPPLFLNLLTRIPGHNSIERMREKMFIDFSVMNADFFPDFLK